MQHDHLVPSTRIGIHRRLAWPLPSPVTPSVQMAGVPSRAKCPAQAARSRSLTWSTRFSSSSRGLGPHHLGMAACVVDWGILQGH